MQVALDTCDRTTVYADLREDESLTDALRDRAIERARELGAQHVEFWRPPYGRGQDRMAGFIELARVAAGLRPASVAFDASRAPSRSGVRRT